VFREATKNKKFNPGMLIGVLIFHILAIGAIFTFSWPGFIAFLVITCLTGCLGVTMGFHRLLTHRSFTVSKPLKYFLTFLGCLTLQGGPVRWVATHRLHHKNADTPNDPHSSEEGFLWSHLIWNFYQQPELESMETLKRFAPDIYNDPVLRFMDEHFFSLYLVSGILFFLVGTWLAGWQIGLSLVFWGWILRIVYFWHITWLVNSATHYWGYQTFPSIDKSRNNWWVALLTFGEGWHNNHHAYPRSARMGLAWYELDVTYWIINLLERAGLAMKVVGIQKV
jgi:sn-1 stearoyl-lipid 9-desaturase